MASERISIDLSSNGTTNFAGLTDAKFFTLEYFNGLAGGDYYAVSFSNKIVETAVVGETVSIYSIDSGSKTKEADLTFLANGIQVTNSSTNSGTINVIGVEGAGASILDKWLLLQDEVTNNFDGYLAYDDSVGGMTSPLLENGMYYIRTDIEVTVPNVYTVTNYMLRYFYCQDHSPGPEDFIKAYWPEQRTNDWGAFAHTVNDITGIQQLGNWTGDGVVVTWLPAGSGTTGFNLASFISFWSGTETYTAIIRWIKLFSA